MRAHREPGKDARRRSAIQVRHDVGQAAVTVEIVSHAAAAVDFPRRVVWRCARQAAAMKVEPRGEAVGVEDRLVPAVYDQAE